MSERLEPYELAESQTQSLDLEHWPLGQGKLFNLFRHVLSFLFTLAFISHLHMVICSQRVLQPCLTTIVFKGQLQGKRTPHQDKSHLHFLQSAKASPCSCWLQMFLVVSQQ